MSAIKIFDLFKSLRDVTWGSIADGQLLKRSGTNIIGVTAGGGTGDVVGPASAADNDVAVFSGTTGKLIKTTARQVSTLGDMNGQASSVDSEISLFSGTGGKTIKRATGTGYVTVANGIYQSPTAADSVGRMPRGHMWGLTLSNNGADVTNDIDIAAGEARDSTNAVDIVLASAITKRLDAAWAVGTNQGGLDTGAIADVAYHVWLIKRADTGVVDALFSASLTSPTMPANYTHKRRVGFIRRISGTIRAFIQTGDWFEMVNPTLDIVTSTLSTVSTSFTFTSFPTGLKLRVGMNVVTQHATIAVAVIIRDPDATDLAPSSTTSPLNNSKVQVANGISAGGQLFVMTNTSAQIAARSGSSATTFNAVIFGWFDTRDE